MKQIVILNRSWNIVGDVEKNGSDKCSHCNQYRDVFYTVTNGSVIRNWGTTKGLGELAMKGPLKETILDPLPLVTAHYPQVIFTVDCEKSNWN